MENNGNINKWTTQSERNNCFCSIQRNSAPFNPVQKCFNQHSIEQFIVEKLVFDHGTFSILFLVLTEMTIYN